MEKGAHPRVCLCVCQIHSWSFLIIYVEQHPIVSLSILFLGTPWSISHCPLSLGWSCNLLRPIKMAKVTLCQLQSLGLQTDSLQFLPLPSWYAEISTGQGNPIKEKRPCKGIPKWRNTKPTAKANCKTWKWHQLGPFSPANSAVECSYVSEPRQKQKRNHPAHPQNHEK